MKTNPTDRRGLHVLTSEFPVRLYCKQTGQPDRTPIFLLHGDKANGLLPKHLPDSIPFYAYYHMRFDGKKLKYLSVEQIAELYLKELKAVQPEGPYFISGFSLGGMIAFEMASILRRNGEEVKALVFLDSKSSTVEGQKLYHNQQFKWTESRLTKVPRKIYKKVVVAVASKLNLPIPKSQRPFYLLEQYRKGRKFYRPEPYPGNIILLRSTIDNFEDRYLGWRDFVGGEVIIHDIETDHHKLTVEPVIQEVAGLYLQIYEECFGKQPEE